MMEKEKAKEKEKARAKEEEKDFKGGGSMRVRLEDDELSIGQQRAKIGIGKYQMFKDGLFNPVCPQMYNFLTGWEDGKPVGRNHYIDYAGNGKVNGKEVNNN